MQQLSEISDPSGWLSVLAAGIALLGVLISVWVSSVISRRSVFVNSVTLERSKWIEKLRSNLADFYSATSNLHFLALKADPNERVFDVEPDLVREVEKLAALIRLQLNPKGEIDTNIILLLGHIPHIACEKSDLFGTAQDLLILHSQWLLKEEWEKVKVEASGFLKRAWFCKKANTRKLDYFEFCKTEQKPLDTIKAFGKKL